MADQDNGYSHDQGQGEGDMMNAPRGHGGPGMGERPRTQRDVQRQQEIDYYEEELSRLDDSFPCARNALESELYRFRGNVSDMIDAVNNRKSRVRCRIAIPQDSFPGINFVGKLLGQGGSTLKKLQEDCNVKMAILGRGSMRDPQKEQEAFESGDPKFQHLKQALHLQIDCLDAPEEAYYRISRAIYEVKNIMTPDPSELAAAAAGQGGGYPGGFYPGTGGRGRGRGAGEGFGGGGGFRGGRGGRGGGRGSFGDRGGGFGGDSGNGQPTFGQDYGQSFGGGKSAPAPPARGGRGGFAPRRGSHPYGRGAM